MRSFPDVVRRSHRNPCRLGSRLPILLLFTALLSGCGYWINPNAVVPSGPGTPSQSGSVTISPTYVALSPGQKFQFTATSASGGRIEWLVNSLAGGKPDTGQVDASGIYTAPAI